MKISIKYKVPMVIILGFCLYVLFLAAYYRFFILNDAMQNYILFQDSLNQVSEEVSIGIEARYPDSESMNSFIHSVSEEEDIKIEVYDTEGNKIFTAGKSDSKNIGFRAKDFVSINGKLQYILELEHPFMFKKFLLFDYMGKLAIFAVVLLCFFVFGLIVYLHHVIVNPIINLQKSFEKVSYHSNKAAVYKGRKNEIGDLYNKYEEMLKKLEISRHQQLEMISSISHDLKTPLTSILGFVERLSEDKVKDEQKKQEYYSIIHKKAQDIEGLIEEFTTYTKNEYSCLNLKKQKISVMDLYSSICYEYCDELKAFDVEFDCHNDTNNDDWIEVDVYQLRRVFANLVSNSLKYIQPPRKIRIMCKSNKSFVSFYFEDNGKGVSAEDLDLIFNVFYRVEKSRSREKGGSGLGLAISKSIIESHQGNIWAYNVEGGGFGIAFTLPLAM